MTNVKYNLIVRQKFVIKYFEMSVTHFEIKIS